MTHHRGCWRCCRLGGEEVHGPSSCLCTARLSVSPSGVAQCWYFAKFHLELRVLQPLMRQCGHNVVLVCKAVAVFVRDFPGFPKFVYLFEGTFVEQKSLVT